MINEATVRREDLEPVYWQYTVSHENPTCFALGETVFLKSNLELPMTVTRINESGTVETTWVTKSGEQTSYEFVPQCILQYKYAGLFSHGDRHISLN